MQSFAIIEVKYIKGCVRTYVFQAESTCVSSIKASLFSRLISDAAMYLIGVFY